MRQRIGLRQVRALRPGEIIWDASVVGFGARRQRSEAVTYVLFYRTREGRRQRWVTIGRHGAPWTPDTAREEARRLLAKVVDGQDPSADKRAARHAATVSELCDFYLADAAAGRLLMRRGTVKKPATLVTDRSRIEAHIKPLLGERRVAAVTREDVDRFMHDVAEGKSAASHARGGKGRATRTIGLLGAIFAYAVKRHMRVDNPCRGIVKFADGKRERRLTDDEYSSLGEALRAADAAGIWPPAIQAIRLLALTGWRRGEVLGLCWHELDLARRTATLSDTKTGRSVRPLAKAACELLHSLPRKDGLVFPPARHAGTMAPSFPQLWARIAALGALPADVTAHVLRHSFASLAGDLGYAETTIAALIGHTGRSITSRYVHAADAVLLAAADAVADRTRDLMKW
jgi:integrase